MHSLVTKASKYQFAASMVKPSALASRVHHSFFGLKSVTQNYIANSGFFRIVIFVHPIVHAEVPKAK